MCYTHSKKAANFERFLRDVDRKLEDRVGLSKDDLPDFDYASAFEDGLTPAATAHDALAAADYF